MVISATAVQGKVAMILNDREVVINRGKEHGVELGTRYKVVETVQVKDPDTKETIGTIEREKIRFEIAHLEPAMSIARTYETYTYGGHPAFRDNDSLRRHLNPSANIMPRTDVKRIRPSSQESTGENTGPDAVPIEIGDVVVEVTE